MFTGLIEERGTITAIEQLPDAVRLTVSGNTALQGAQQGEHHAEPEEQQHTHRQ